MLAHNLNTVFANRNPKARYLLRSLNGELRGFLSDRYRRLDSRPIIEAFATAVQRKGALPYDGYVTDTKVAIQAIMPEVYEPVPGEMVAYGLSLENSDFGNGALSIRAYLLRIWCTNLAITQEEMRQVHLGKRLDDSTLYSNRTYELDAKTTVSALRDVIDGQLDADSLKRRMEAIRHANQQIVGTEKPKRPSGSCCRRVNRKLRPRRSTRLTLTTCQPGIPTGGFQRDLLDRRPDQRRGAEAGPHEDRW